MQRRAFTMLLGGVIAASPLAARAQQQGRRVPKLAYVATGSETDRQARARYEAFIDALGKLGWRDGRNIQILQYWSAGVASRATATEIIRMAPDVILAEGNPPTEALRAETSTIPIVFAHAVDPLSAGLVNSMARPSGNATGFTSFDFPMGGKWLEMLKEVAPGLKRVQVILFLQSAGQREFLRAVEAAAKVLGLEITTLNSTAAEIEGGIEAFAREPNGGLLVLFAASAMENRDLIIAMAARHRLPAMYANRAFIAGGGLMSYDTEAVDIFRRAASYVDRILRGEKPGDLPVQNPIKFELVINLKTARALDLTVPLPLLALADEVIE